jgi:hypothetical protein
MHKLILLAILPLAAFAAKEPHSWPVTGVVTEECAVAVSVKTNARLRRDTNTPLRGCTNMGNHVAIIVM